MQRLSQAASAIGAQLHGADASWRGAAIDTRKLAPGQLFIALPGTRVDGHEFVRKAAALGAAGALVSRPVDIDFPQLVVGDVLAAMQALGQAMRQHWGGRIVAVTGSNGKTGVKTMLATILGQDQPVFATPGNLNNHIGVPPCLLNLQPEQRLAVLEMGASARGEIAFLAGMAKPDVGIVTLAGDAHLQGFGSRDGVAAGKGELFAALAADGVAVINADDPYCPSWQALAAHCTQRLFGRAVDADVRAEEEEHAPLRQRFVLCMDGQRHPLSLNLPGAHNVMNALAAAAGAAAMGASPAQIVAGLEAVRPVPGRLSAQELPGGVLLIDAPSGATVIDDCYNANPGSLQAAISVLAECPAPRHLVLGDMGELGGDAERLHADVGAVAADAGIEALWACGPLSAAAVRRFGERGRHFTDRKTLAEALRAALCPGASVLVKGSRSAGMDEVVTLLKGEG